MSSTNVGYAYTYAQDITLVVMICGECGVTFGLESTYRNDRLKNHKLEWYCPNGHSRVFSGKTDEERLKAELKAERDHAAYLRASLDQTEASRRAFKGQATRLRNRALRGECPVCGTHVYQLARHMTRLHPGEQQESEE